MRGIAEWLTSIGLGEYAQRFAENAIDLTVVRDLTEQDLKDLGVLLGHRRKMLRAIAELRASAAPESRGSANPRQQLIKASHRKRDCRPLDQVSAVLSDTIGSAFARPYGYGYYGYPCYGYSYYAPSYYGYYTPAYYGYYSPRPYYGYYAPRRYYGCWRRGYRVC
jgi:hypothetical protein